MPTPIGRAIIDMESLVKEHGYDFALKALTHIAQSETARARMDGVPEGCFTRIRWRKTWVRLEEALTGYLTGN